MLHRPSLIPDTMKMSFKNSHQKQKVAKPEFNLGVLFCDDEIVIVEPTDPDEDRLKQQQQQQQQQQKETSLRRISDPQVDSCCLEDSSSSVSDSIEQNNDTVLTINADSLQEKTVTTTVTATHPGSDTANYAMTNALQSALNLASALAVSKHLHTVSHESFPTSCSQSTGSTDIKNLEGMSHPSIQRTATDPKHPPSKLADPSAGQSTLKVSLPIGNLNIILPALLSSDSITLDLATNLLLSISRTNIDQIVNASTNVSDLDRVVSLQVMGSKSKQPQEKPSMTDTVSFNDKRPTKITDRKRRLNCPVASCPLTFSNKFNLTEHIRTHTGERPFVCSVTACAAAFKRHRSLREHMKVHNADETVPPTVTCHRPSSQFTNQFGPHPLPENNSCLLSGCQNFPLAYTTDTFRTTQADPVVIGEHNKPTRTEEEDFDMHKKGIKEDSSTSSMKDASFCTSRPDSPLRFPCPNNDCGKVFLKANKLREHARIHTGERPYACPHPGCVATFSRAYGVRRHIQSHTLGLRNPIRWSRLAADLHDMVECRDGAAAQHHDIMLPVLMPNDQAVQSTLENILNSAVETDLSSTHNPPTIAPKIQGTLSFRPIAPLPSGPGILRPHSCPFKDCTKTFAKMYQLRDHIWGHTGRRPFACNYCYSSFVRLYDLRRHEKIHFRATAARCDPADCNTVS
ncbi:hypothetical protein D915_000557 [Fasciola hepatica]|uniref:C2H2-type domain-containing protein n=1 Tax=Fasciola hepatica TaxID=6192 RepID=A0A4E0RIH0_FASHE|nr:hypothetical protein D915_000557 [Fasciola hepatica]